jgi:hypothetical protein
VAWVAKLVAFLGESRFIVAQPNNDLQNGSESSSYDANAHGPGIGEGVRTEAWARLAKVVPQGITPIREPRCS